MSTTIGVGEPFGTDKASISAPLDAQRISFTGTGGEYFRIWFVNLLLTICTLGIYSAWAKVRRMRYFYDNTRLAGSSFEYHGNPVSIFKGRIIAAVLFGGYNIAFRISPKAGLVMLAVLAAVFPWLLWKSLQFKLHNSSYRGIRFSFRGSVGQVYLHYLAFVLLSYVTVGLFWPFAHQRMKKFQHEESHFGAARFSFDASVGSFYKIYLIAFGVAVGGMIAIGLLFGSALIAFIAAKGNPQAMAGALLGLMAFMFAAYAWLFLVFAISLTLTQNLVWNHTALNGHRFQSRMKAGKVVFIMVTNVIGVICTLGFFAPVAKIRMLKYRLESVSLMPQGSLDNFVAGEQENVTAAGDGAADIMDFDLSL